MAMEREAIIDLMDRLGSADDADVLAAARMLHSNVTGASLTWDDLLRSEASWPSADAVATEGAPAPDLEGQGDLTATQRSDAERTIAGLLLRKGLSDTLREDLDGLRDSLREGTFEAMDYRYVRALAKRLDA